MQERAYAHALPCGWGSGGGGRVLPTALPVHRMEELGLHPADCQVYFGQLLGMCDQISFPLGELGFRWGAGGRGGGAGTHRLHPCVQDRQATPCTSMCLMAL